MTLNRAFTLLETLVVLALLALVTGVIVQPLVASNRAVQTRAFGLQFLALDDAARRLAVEHEGCVVLIGNDKVAIMQLPDAQNPLRPPLAIPDGLSARASTDGTEHDSIRFDSAGRCADYRLTVSRDAHSRQWLVHGLTGALTELHEPLE